MIDVKQAVRIAAEYFADILGHQPALLDVVGRLDPKLVSKHKRTAAYTLEDFILLEEIVGAFLEGSHDTAHPDRGEQPLGSGENQVRMWLKLTTSAWT